MSWTWSPTYARRHRRVLLHAPDRPRPRPMTVAQARGQHPDPEPVVSLADTVVDMGLAMLGLPARSAV